jgi:DNA repair exonuclease SbcCD nuclease subunit
MFKFIHTADIHLDSPFKRLQTYEGAPVQELRAATRKALMNLVQTAIEEQAHFIVIAGDLFDGDWKDYNTGLFFISQMNLLAEASIPVFILSGNHDAANRMTRSLRLPPGIRMFPNNRAGTFFLEESGVALHGQGFQKASVREDLSLSYPAAEKGYYNIGVLHTCLNGREGHEPYAPCTLEGLKSHGYDYWALGPVHQREIVSREPFVVFPGNTQGRHIREEGSKGCMVVTVNDSVETDIRFQPLDVIRWKRIHVDASECTDAFDIADLVAERLKEHLDRQGDLPLIARIIIHGRTKAHDVFTGDLERWNHEIKASAMSLGGIGVWVEKVSVETRPAVTPVHDKDDPMAEISNVLNSLRKEPESLKAMAESIHDTMKALPPELRRGVMRENLQSEEWLCRLLDRIEPLLRNRLIKDKGEQ